MSNVDAAIFTDNKRYASIAQGKDFTFETVLSSKYKLDLLKTAKKAGYFVEYDKVVERYYKSLKNIKELLEICDIMHVYDNSSVPYRIIRKHKEFLTIYPNEFWSVEEIDKLIK